MEETSFTLWEEIKFILLKYNEKYPNEWLRFEAGEMLRSMEYRSKWQKKKKKTFPSTLELSQEIGWYAVHLTEIGESSDRNI